MNSQKYNIYLTAEERRQTLQCLNDLRTALLSKGKYTDAVDELLDKFFRAKLKRVH